MKRWKRPLRAHRRTQSVPTLEILEVRELLTATPDKLAATALLGDLTHLRDDFTASTVALLNTQTPIDLRSQCNQTWNTLAADCQTAWQQFVRYEFAALAAVRQEFDTLIGDRGLRPADRISSSPPTLAENTPSSTNTMAAGGGLAPVPGASSISKFPLSATPLYSPPPPSVYFYNGSNSRVEETTTGHGLIVADLSAPSTQSISVQYASTGGSAIPGIDYQPISGTMYFAPGAISASADVPILDDNAVNEPPETINFALSNPSGAALGDPSTFTITILEDEGSSSPPPPPSPPPSAPLLPPSLIPATAPNCGCNNQPGDLVQNSPAPSELHTPAQNLPAGAPNPPGLTTAHPVRYADGEVVIARTDLMADGFGFPWGQTRSWTNNNVYSQGGVNGSGWIDTYTPHLMQADGSSNETIIVVSNDLNDRYYDLENGVYMSRFADPSQLTYNSTNDTFSLIDGQGDTIVFAGFGSGWQPAQQGQFIRYTDPYGTTMAVTSYTGDGHIAEMQRSETSGGNTTTESWLNSYLPTGDANAGLLSGVTLRRQVNGGAWSTVRQVQYAYYDGTQQYGGNVGDLMTATVLDGSNNVLSTDYYRYYTPGAANGYPDGLEYVFNPQSYARLTAALGTNLGSLTDAQVAPFADNYFQYDSSQRTTEEVVQGAGSSTDSGGLGTYTYSYTSSGNTPDFNNWTTKTVVTNPDGSTDTVYTNYFAEVLLDDHYDPTSAIDTITAYRYNEKGELILAAAPSAVQATDRNGNVHQYTLDVLGRVTSDAVTTLGAGVDGSVRRIEYKYDSQGNTYLITSFDAPTGGNIVNQVQRVFNGLGQLTGEYQSHSGAVVVGSTPEVQYAYTEMSGGQNNSRLVSMTYPSGYTLNFNYNARLDSTISRLSSISDSGGTLESYKYLGLGTVIERDHPQNNVNQTLIKQGSDPNANGDGGDQYTGLDRFNRVIDQFWVNASTGAAVDRNQYGYNQDGDRLYRQNLVDAAMSELYGYDNLHQLTSFQRGTLNATHNGLTGSASRSQSWSPDALGNFNSVTTNGSTQTRTANQQNEITSISGSGTITYDANGNLTADGSGNTYVYDAWNRLVAVKSNGSLMAAYGYNGDGQRITETHGSTTTDLYYSSSWQVIEERVGGVVQARNVWSPVYVDALVLRDQSSQHNGVLDQRLYAIQDANWNVTALVDTSGNVLERDAYDPYGAMTVLNPDWSVRGASNYGWLYGFQGGRYDSTANSYFFQRWEELPALGVWQEPDPLAFAAGDVDLYRLVNNNPVTGIDPSGLSLWERFKDGWGQFSRGVGELLAAAGRAADRVAENVGNLAQGRVNPAFVNGLRKIGDDPAGNGWEAGKIAVGMVTAAPRKLGEGLATGDGRKILEGGAETGLLYLNGRQLGRSLQKQCPAPRGGRVLPGHTEWVPDPRRAGVAQRELRALEAEYTRETGLRPDLARRRPLGETRDAGFDPRTGEIFVYDDVLPAFREGFLAEELHHYQQVRDAGHLGRTLQEIEKLEPGFATRMEQDVLGRVRGSGFIPYDPRNYAPYTNVPRPPGVAGSQP